jgi:transcriptional regulator with XRE-family HTH domain
MWGGIIFVTVNTLCMYNQIKYKKQNNMKNDWIKRAKSLMAEQGVTQLDLVTTMKVKSRGTISHYFCGRNEPTLEALTALAKHLNVTPQYLFFGGEKNREVNGTLLSKCSKVVRDLNIENNLGLTEDQQVQLVIFIYNQSQKDEGIEMLSKKQISDTATLLLNTLAV